MTATMHLLCGKIASGKSTLAAQLASTPGTILVSEDEWLSTLFPGEIKTLEDYRLRTMRLEAVLGPHLAHVLTAGSSVVLDFHANTRRRRAWARGVLDASGAQAQLHLLDVPDEVCKARLRARNAEGTHAYNTSDAVFDQFSARFESPHPDEGWTIIQHRAD